MSVRQLRVVVTAEDYDDALRFTGTSSGELGASPGERRGDELEVA